MDEEDKFGLQQHLDISSDSEPEFEDTEFPEMFHFFNVKPIEIDPAMVVKVAAPTPVNYWANRQKFLNDQEVVNNVPSSIDEAIPSVSNLIPETNTKKKKAKAKKIHESVEDVNDSKLELPSELCNFGLHQVSNETCSSRQLPIEPLPKQKTKFVPFVPLIEVKTMSLQTKSQKRKKKRKQQKSTFNALDTTHFPPLTAKCRVSVIKETNCDTRLTDNLANKLPNRTTTNNAEFDKFFEYTLTKHENDHTNLPLQSDIENVFISSAKIETELLNLGFKLTNTQQNEVHQEFNVSHPVQTENQNKPAGSKKKSLSAGTQEIRLKIQSDDEDVYFETIKVDVESSEGKQKKQKKRRNRTKKKSDLALNEGSMEDIKSIVPTSSSETDQINNVNEDAFNTESPSIDVIKNELGNSTNFEEINNEFCEQSEGHSSHAIENKKEDINQLQNDTDNNKENTININEISETQQATDKISEDGMYNSVKTELEKMHNLNVPDKRRDNLERIITKLDKSLLLTKDQNDNFDNCFFDLQENSNDLVEKSVQYEKELLETNIDSTNTKACIVDQSNKSENILTAAEAYQASSEVDKIQTNVHVNGDNDKKISKCDKSSQTDDLVGFECQNDGNTRETESLFDKFIFLLFLLTCIHLIKLFLVDSFWHIYFFKIFMVFTFFFGFYKSFD